MNRKILTNYRQMRQRLLRAITEAEELEAACEEYLVHLSGTKKRTTRRLLNTMATSNMLEILRSLNNQLRTIANPPLR